MTQYKKEKAEIDRRDYGSGRGIARWWSKDSAWHIALPVPSKIAGLRTGGYRWTEDAYNTREEAIAAIESQSK